MSRRYSAEVVREACTLYSRGLSSERVAEEMRRNGHTAFSAETMRRWAHQYDLAKAQKKGAAENIRAGLLLDSQRATNELLEVAIDARKAVTEKLSSGGIDYIEVVGLLKKIDALISNLVNAKAKA